MASLGLLLLSFQPIFMAAGAFLADFNETHVYNPRWPPHARFHNGQTMSMSVTLGAACLYYTWHTVSLPTAMAKRESLFTAALIGSIYCFTGLTAILYPGTAGTDPEFGEGFPQKWVFGIPLLINWVGYLVEKRRIDGEEKSKAA